MIENSVGIARSGERIVLFVEDFAELGNFKKKYAPLTTDNLIDTHALFEFLCIREIRKKREGLLFYKRAQLGIEAIDTILIEREDFELKRKELQLNTSLDRVRLGERLAAAEFKS